MKLQRILKCQICGEMFKAITQTHLKKHNMTLEEYRLAFPKAITMTEAHRKIIGEASIDRLSTKASRENLSRKLKKYYREHPVTDEIKEKIRQSSLGSVLSTETKKKRIESQKRFWREHPEARVKLSKKIKKLHQEKKRKHK